LLLLSPAAISLYHRQSKPLSAIFSVENKITFIQIAIIMSSLKDI